MSDERPPREEPPSVRRRLPFETDQPRGAAFRQASLVVYGVLVAGLFGLALYMALVVGHPLTSAYVAGPVIGALWFGLRLFMIWGSGAGKR